MKTLQNKSPPLPLAVTLTVPLPQGCPEDCSFIYGGRHPATAPQTSSGTCQDRERGPRLRNQAWKGAKASRQWDMKEVIATHLSYRPELATYHTGCGQGEGGGPLPALSAPEVSSPYCELESLL